MQFSATSRHHCGRPQAWTRCALTKADDTVLLAFKLHRLSRGRTSAIGHLVTATTDPRLYIACSHCRLEKESTWETSLTPTHTIAARNEKRWWGQCRQHYRRTAFATYYATTRCRRFVTQRDVCASLRNVMAALRSAWRFDIMAEWWQQH